MNIDISRFRVIYKEKVLNAVTIFNFEFNGDVYPDDRKTIEKFKEIEILAINEDGELISILDEGWMFQFIPIIQREIE